MNYFSAILILLPLVYAQNNTVGSTRFFGGGLNRSPLDWFQQALGTASNAFSLGVETGAQWFNFGLNTANQWANALTNAPNSTTFPNPQSLEEQRLYREIARLQKELANQGTWFRRVKERRLQILMDKLNSLHDNAGNNPGGSTATPLDVSKYNFSITTPARPTPVPSSPKTTPDDTVISILPIN